MVLQSVAIPVLAPALLGETVGHTRLDELNRTADSVRRALGPRSVLNINSTAVGGGVAEMLHTLIGYARGAGIDVRWSVLNAPPDFYVLTKLLHHLLHGVAVVGPFEEEGRALYEDVLHQQFLEVQTEVRPGDVVILHDPQTAGMVPMLMNMGARVAWRCHVGTAARNAATERGWAFLRPYLSHVDLIVSQGGYLPDWVSSDRIFEIAPSIDPLSPKNRELDPAFSRALLNAAGLVSNGGNAALNFTRRDGSRGRVERVADVLQAGPAPRVTDKIVLQVSRWDPLKDMAGVMRAFTEYVLPRCDSHLILAGPNVTAVADDPEGGAVLQDCMADWAQLSSAARRRVHLACLPMGDMDENGLLVNALQRVASVVVQKSLAEGFGLTVTEAMWKGRAVVASRVGGIATQIVSGASGVLIDDPSDLAHFGAEICALLNDPMRAEQLGRRAKQSVSERFLPDRHLKQWANLVLQLVEKTPGPHYPMPAHQ